MAVILVEGFDAYNGVANTTATAIGFFSRWVNPSGSATAFSTTAGRFGGQGVGINTGISTTNSKLLYVPITGANTGTVGFAFYYSEVGSNVIFSLYQGTVGNNTVNAQLSIGITAVGILRVLRGATELFTAADALVVATWNYIELEFYIADTGGFANLYINGALAGSISGADTRNVAATDTYNFIAIGADLNISAPFYAYDDLYVTNTATRLGEQRVVTVVPTSDGTPSQWAASGGVVPPYTMVDEVLCDGDTTYIFDGTVNDRAVFNMASTGATPVSVSAVQIGTFTRKTDTGTRAIQLQYVDSGGTAYSSSGITLGSNYGRQVSLLENNPATATAWTPAEANTLKTGVKVSV